MRRKIPISGIWLPRPGWSISSPGVRTWCGARSRRRVPCEAPFIGGPGFDEREHLWLDWFAKPPPKT